MRYAFSKAREAGGLLKLYRALKTPNACKTCALGMGGAKGGMVNERGHRFEVCKKSIQAMVADMQGRVPADFFEKVSVAQMQQMTPRELEHMGRLVEPMYLRQGATHFEPLSWDAAFDKISGKMSDIPSDEAFFYFSGRSSNEAAYSLHRFAKEWGCAHTNNCSFYCHQASGVGLKSITGTGTATVVLQDLEKCDLLFLIGANPASNHPRFLKQLVDLRRRGGKVIVINPVKELGLTRFRVPSDWRSMIFGSKIADVYLQPHIGGDIALFTGLAKATLESGGENIDFLNQHTVGFEASAQVVKETPWVKIEAESGISRQKIENAAALYGQSKRTIFSWAMGITHHLHGVDNVRSIGNLALLRGMVGKPGAGFLPLRGHSNVQGIGSVGVVPGEGGYDTLACMEAAARDEMQLAFCLGGNLFASNPDSHWAASALNKVDLLVHVNTTLNTGHAWGNGKDTLILPVLARDEESQQTTQESMFNFVRFSAGGEPRHIGPRSEQELVCEIATRVSPDDNWDDFRDHDFVRKEMAAQLESYKAVVAGKEHQIDGRTFHQPHFARPDQKAQLHPVQLPNLSSQSGPSLRLMSVRSEGQFNSVVYEESDLYRGQERRDVILLHPDDMARLSLAEDQQVTVQSDTGQLPGIRVRPFDVRPGNALMYYPEANVFYPRSVDAESRTPAYKNVRVSLLPMGAIPC